MPWTRRIALAALALALAQAAWASISVAPLGLDLTLAAGQRAVGSFLVKNVSEEAQGVSVELVDYFQTVDGQNQFLAPGALARSLAPYVTYAPADFEVAPGQVQEVQFAVELPEEAGGPRWTVCMLRQRGPSA